MGVERTLKELLTRYRWLNVAYGVLQHGPRALSLRGPANRGPDEIQPPPFFIIGAARSGNTLLRALLVGHSEISIPPESYVLGGIIRQWDRHNFQEWDVLVDSVIGEFESHPEFSTWEIDLAPVRQVLNALDPSDRSLARILDAIYRHYSAVKFPGFRIWGDKTPLNTERIFLIDRVFPAARYVHMLRDGRDAVSSAVKADMFGGSVEGACRSWLLRTRNARQLGRRVGVSRYLELRYEDLVAGPKDQLTALLNFLSLEWNDSMLEYQTHAHNETSSTPSYQQVSQPLYTRSIGKWRHYSKQIESGFSILEPWVKQFGYEEMDTTKRGE